MKLKETLKRTYYAILSGLLFYVFLTFLPTQYVDSHPVISIFILLSLPLAFTWILTARNRKSERYIYISIILFSVLWGIGSYFIFTSINPVFHLWQFVGMPMIYVCGTIMMIVGFRAETEYYDKIANMIYKLFGKKRNNKKENIREMKKLTVSLKHIYRLSVNSSKQENLVWKDLKKLFALLEWEHGIYEKEKYIECSWEIENKKGARFYYIIDGGYFYCRAFILENFPVELTTDFFILATHLNNLLNHGSVRINVENQFIEYRSKHEILIPLLYSGEIYNDILEHYKVSIDIFWAFQKLVEENEEPTIVFADLMKRIEERSQKQE